MISRCFPGVALIVLIITTTPSCQVSLQAAVTIVWSLGTTLSKPFPSGKREDGQSKHSESSSYLYFNTGPLANVISAKSGEDSSLNLASRIRGAFIGLAVCDALGGPVEFKPRGTFPLHTEMTPNKNFGLVPGSWTDDTSTALCLAESLLKYDGKVHIGDQVERYIAWQRDGYMSVNGKCFDIGGLTRESLSFWKVQLRKTGYHKFKEGSKEAAEVLRSIQQAVSSSFSIVVGSGAKQSPRAGNGSLMRTLPVALIARTDDKTILSSMAKECSRTTHPHAICSDCCVIYVDIIRMALAGASKDEMALAMREWSANQAVHETVRATLSQYTNLDDWMAQPSSNIKSAGYALYALECTFWAFCGTSTFEEGAVQVVNLGWDTDTNGAIYGGLAGAFYGYDAIPQRWLRRMQKMEIIDGIVDRVVAFRGADGKIVGSDVNRADE